MFRSPLGLGERWYVGPETIVFLGYDVYGQSKREVLDVEARDEVRSRSVRTCCFDDVVVHDVPVFLVRCSEEGP